MHLVGFHGIALFCVKSQKTDLQNLYRTNRSGISKVNSSLIRNSLKGHASKRRYLRGSLRQRTEAWQRNLQIQGKSPKRSDFVIFSLS